MSTTLGLDRRALRITWTVLLAASLLWMLYVLRGVLFIFILAVLFAYVVWPLVAVTESLFRKVVPRGRPARLLALAAVYPVLIAAAILMGVVIVPRIAEQGAAMFARASTFLASVEQGRWLEEISRKHGWSLPTLQAVQDQVLRHAGALVPYLQSAAADLLRHLTSVWLVVIVPILAFFLLKDAERLVSGVEDWLSTPAQRNLLREIFTDLNELLARYMRALILLSLLSFTSHLLFFVIARVPNTLLLATLAGMLEFIPLVGPLCAAAAIVGASWLAGYTHLFWILIFLGVWRLTQDYVNMPWLMGSGIELHPLFVIFGILAGAEIAGVPGMFLSVPAMATVRILVRRSMAHAKALESRGAA